MGEFQIWHQRPSEFPLAVVRPREPRARALALLGDFRRWLAARWDWLRPRTVPVLVAGVGMMFVILSADYLAHAHWQHHPSDSVIVHVR